MELHPEALVLRVDEAVGVAAKTAKLGTAAGVSINSAATRYFGPKCSVGTI
jgi:hypothetical protein